MITLHKDAAINSPQALVTSSEHNNDKVAKCTTLPTDSRWKQASVLLTRVSTAPRGPLPVDGVETSLLLYCTIQIKKFNSWPSLVVWWLGICLPMQRHRFDPWSRKIPHVMGRLSRCTTTPKLMRYNYWSPHTATREAQAPQQRVAPALCN